MTAKIDSETAVTQRDITSIAWITWATLRRNVFSFLDKVCLSCKNKFDVNKHSIIKFLNHASPHINSICYKNWTVKLEFVVLLALSSKGVGSAMLKST